MTFLTHPSEKPNWVPPTARLPFFAMVIACLTILASTANGQNLQITYGPKGIQTLTYAGVTLEDVGLYPGDSFHIWHSKSTDLKGSVVSDWGENNNGESWNPATQMETYTFQWGTISTRFAQQGDTLNVIVTETNYAGSGVVFDGAEIYPFALHFPQDPAGFSGYSQTLVTTTGPGVSAADFGKGVVTAVLADESIPMYVGWKNVGINTYSPLMTTTSPDSLAPFLPHQDYPVSPGTTFSYSLSFRFTPEGVAADASDAYGSFRAKYPSQMTWTDKRIIGTAYLASSPASNGNASLPGGFPTNPRRYFNDPSIDITTPSGLRAFQARVLTQAATNVTTSTALYAQGVITWDIEGEQYPQATSYVCSPDQLATVAPEMESTITDTNSPNVGKRLVDAYFQIISSAGLRIGVCLRPQVFTMAPDGTAGQTYLSTNSSIIANLENKARYANTRWGATIFYVDSTVDTYGGTLDPAIFQQLITDLPSFLFIPEESTPRYYAYSAPFYSFIFHDSIGTPAFLYDLYPRAFGANLINDASASALASSQQQLIQAVSKGDILMGHADYWQANDPTLVDIYRAAGVAPVPPVQAAPGILWSQPSPITFGTPLSAAQLNATANTSGVFTYTPAAGTVLSAGTSSLLTTFTPADTRDYTSATSSVSLQIAKATPAISWSNPTPIAAGTPLTPLQMNASASVSGTFAYAPALGTVLNSGVTTLQGVFTPSDTTDYTTASGSVTITVLPQSQTAPAIIWSTPASIRYGTPLSSAQLNATSNAAGTFTYMPGVGTVLSAGTSNLLATFTPADTRSYSTATSSVRLTVIKATPVLNWSAPQPIAAGIALASAQLNATANVPGSFTYNPGAGTVLASGTTTLHVTFMPTDTTDYNAISTSANLTVLPQQKKAPALAWPSPASIVYGTVLSAAQLKATANVAGTFQYSPGAGAVLQAGSEVLSVSFTPADSSHYTSASIITTLKVTPATPILSWPAPAYIRYGTSLGAGQLNAAANVPGSFTYSPSAGSVLAVGTQTLAVLFVPSDSRNYVSNYKTVPLTVTAPPAVGNAKLAILGPVAGDVVSGSIVVTAQCLLSLDSAGTYLMVDGVEVGTRRVTDRPYLYPLDTTGWTNGIHIFQLWGHDIANVTTLSAPITVTVRN